jgi:phytoene dehydrogenase-like protein
MPRAVVIGGGLAGLSAAVSLAARGHAVSLIEGQPGVGGKARAVEGGSVPVDVGPTVLTDLAPLGRVFSEAGVALEDAVALERVDPALLAVFPGGRRLAMHTDPARLVGELDGLGLTASADWRRLLDLGARAARLVEHYYAHGDVGRARDLVGFAIGGGVALRDVLPFARRGSLESLLVATIRTGELRRLLAHFARFVGLDAAAAPAVILFIPYLFATSGVWHPRGGVAALAATVAALAAKLGAEIECGEPVSRLEITGGRIAAAITWSGRRIPADVCVSAVDVGALARCMPDGSLGHRTRRLQPALAARVAWWVLEAPPRLPHHHVFHFHANPEAEPLYVATPGVTDPDLAPAGGTVLHALEHGEPARLLRDGFADELRHALEFAGQWPEGKVLAHGVAGGAASCYGYRIGAGLLSGFRPSQRVPGLANLFLAGASVFPGPGVANVIRSGLRAAALADAAVAGGRG